MTIGLPEYISLTALAVSVGGLFYAKRQGDIAKAAALNDYRAHLADKHARYNEALRKVQKEYRPVLADISEAAGKTLVSVVHIADEFDLKGHTPRYLRHLLHEASEMLFKVFQGQLAWQTGLNLSHRLHAFTYVEDRLSPTENYFGGGNFHQIIRKAYFRNENALLESQLLHDTHFCALVTELKARLDGSQRQALMGNVEQSIKTMREKQARLIPQLRESVAQLEELIDEGKREHFSLAESQALYGDLIRQKVMLENLSYLRLPELTTALALNTPDYTSRCIHICALLHAMQSIHSWGWR